MTEIILFLTGALLCNAIPHLAAGLRGEPFPTPFAKPRGIGHSSPLVNFYWGSLNLAAGLILLNGHPVAELFSPEAGAAAAGFLAIGTHLAWHFGKVGAGKL